MEVQGARGGPFSLRTKLPKDKGQERTTVVTNHRTKDRPSRARRTLPTTELPSDKTTAISSCSVSGCFVTPSGMRHRPAPCSQCLSSCPLLR